MFKQRIVPALAPSVFVFVMLCLLSSVVAARTGTTASTNFTRAADNTLAAAKQELLDAAKAHGVSIQVERMLYVSDGRTTIVHAPITGSEKYRSADFAAGAPILLVIVNSTMRLAVSNGSYVVRAQYESGASSGKVSFVNRRGIVAGQRDLIIRTWKQSGILFPGAYGDPPPVGIPNITSSHIISWQNGIAHYYFDCSGVNGTLYFEMG